MHKYLKLASFLIGLPVLVLLIVFWLDGIDWYKNNEFAVVNGDILYERHQRDATVDIEITLHKSGVKALDDLLLERVKNVEASFEKDIQDFVTQADLIPSLHMKTRPYIVYASIVNAVLETEIYTGGAHGETGVITYVFNQINEQQMRLLDMFTEQQWDAVSRSIIQKLSLRDDVNKDSMTDLMNTTVLEWIVDEKGFTIFFNPYEIAPYGSGVIEVMVPWEEIPG